VWRVFDQAKVAKFSWRGPLTTVGMALANTAKKKLRNNSESGSRGSLYKLKKQSTPKRDKKRTEKQNDIKYQNVS